MNHDVVAIGASAGALDVLLNMVAELPGDLPASLFVVMHTQATHASHLPELLTTRGRLPASHPTHEEKILPGRIYVAPPDNHLLLRVGTMEVVRGPKENGHRPAADALFRSASASYGPRVIGVVLSGYQDCGTAGMMSIKARGGLSVIQDPKTALAPEMPKSVLTRVPVDHVVKPQELGSLVARLVSEPEGAAHEPNKVVRQIEGDEPGVRAELVCPICQGVLTEAQPGVYHHFRCHVGHTFSLESLISEQSEEMERALWASVRALEEGAALSQRLTASSNGELKRRFAEKATTQTRQADLIREILLHGAMLTRPDAAKISPNPAKD